MEAVKIARIAANSAAKRLGLHPCRNYGGFDRDDVVSATWISVYQFLVKRGEPRLAHQRARWNALDFMRTWRGSRRRAEGKAQPESDFSCDNVLAVADSVASFKRSVRQFKRDQKRAEAVETLERLTRWITPRDWAMVRRVRQDGATYTEAAAEFNVSVSTVNHILTDVRKLAQETAE